MKRFYSHQITNGEAVLEGTERDHCIKVLRTVIGEQVEIADGQGRVYEGVMISSDRKRALIRLQSDGELQERPLLPTLITAIPKNSSRWEWILEKATEIGVQRIIPVTTKRSEKHNIRRERSEQIILSAFKQSGRYYLPPLEDPQPLSKILERYSHNDTQRYVGYCGEGMKLFLRKVYQPGRESVVMIGPEGDFTEEEIAQCVASGFVPVSLGKSRLRVETAAVAACTIIQCMEE